MSPKTAFILKYRELFKPPCPVQSEEAIEEFTNDFYNLNINDTLYIENIDKIGTSIDKEAQAITIMTYIFKGARFSQVLIRSCIHSGKIYNLLLLFDIE